MVEIYTTSETPPPAANNQPRRRAYHTKSKAGCGTCKYFLEVTAPSLSGSFYADFWLDELTRVCLSDAAIWHAVVSLGSAHEDFTENHQGSRSLFALKQFNSSIRCLTESRSPRYADRWRALIVSTIFTYICTVKGLHNQTRVHLQAGCNLLRELQDHEGKASAKPNRVRETTIASVPISIAPIKYILTNLQLYLDALEHGCIIDSPALLSQNKTLNTWRSYTAPRSSYLRPDDVTCASRAAESLLSGLILFSQQNAKHLLDLHTGKAGMEVLSMLIVRQEGYTRCFNEIAMAITMFQEEISTSIANPEYRTRLKAHTLLPLRLFHTTNRLLLMQDPDEHDLVKRQMGLSALFTCIVDLVEDIVNLDPTKTRGMPYTAQLFFVAHSGISRLTRQRAIALLRRPRLESGWDSLISASLAEAIMDREREAGREFQLLQGSDTQTHEDEEEEINPVFRIFNINLRKKTHQANEHPQATYLDHFNLFMQGCQFTPDIANLGADLLPLMHRCPPLEEVMIAIGALEASRRAIVKSPSGRYSPDQVALRSYAFRSLEVNRAIMYGADTLFSQGTWSNLDGYCEVDRASPLETMFDLFIEISTFSKMFFEKTEFLNEALFVDDLDTSVLAGQGFVFLQRLQDWYQSTLPHVKTTDTHFKLALANYHSLCLLICKNYTYYDIWDLDSIPILTASEIEKHVDAVVALSTAILQDAVIPGILILFPLRIAGVNTTELSGRETILSLLDRIGRRGFLVSQRIIVDLRALWEYEDLEADFHDGN
ncbi:hypothetical protein FGRMN_4938 [Fusarium graminum]|nr:hypothetical protein FGRMN_4938 [Fusarium graminum]